MHIVRGASCSVSNFDIKLLKLQFNSLTAIRGFWFILSPKTLRFKICFAHVELFHSRVIEFEPFAFVRIGGITSSEGMNKIK